MTITATRLLIEKARANPPIGWMDAETEQVRIDPGLVWRLSNPEREQIPRGYEMYRTPTRIHMTTGTSIIVGESIAELEAKGLDGANVETPDRRGNA